MNTKEKANSPVPVPVPIWYGFTALKKQEKFVMGIQEAKLFLVKLSIGNIPGGIPGIKCKKLERLARKMERDSIKEVKGLIIAQNRSGWFQVAIKNWEDGQYDILLIHDRCLKMVTDEKVIEFATYCELGKGYFPPQPSAA